MRAPDSAAVPASLWQGIATAPWAMALPVLLLGTFSLLFGEHVPAGDGLGWDGLQYAAMVRDLPHMIHAGELNSYYAQRIVPPFVVREALMLARLPLDTASIIRAFEIYNLALLMIACWSWHAIVGALGMSVRGRWIGFGGIFVTYAFSKQTFYYPVLTDVTALTVALLLLQCYLRKRSVALLVVTWIGAFAWPVVGFTGALLQLFMNSRLSPGAIGLPPAARNEGGRHRRWIAIAYATILIICIAAYVYATGGNVDLSTPCQIPDVVTRLLGPGVVPCSYEAAVTGLPALLGAGLALLGLLGSWAAAASVIACLVRVKPGRIAMAGLSLLVPILIVKTISNPALENPSGIRYMLEYMTLPPPGKFLLPLVTLSVFWGPMLVLVVICWRQFSSEIRCLGPGVLGVVALAVPLGLANEPRFITVAWPFCVAGMAMALDRAKLRSGFATAFVVLTLLSAQFWMPLNLAPWQPPDHAGLFEFPKQMYFMHYGLWMNWLSYGIQLPAILVGALWLRNRIEGFRQNAPDAV